MTNFSGYFSLYEGTDPPPIITSGYKEVQDTYKNLQPLITSSSSSATYNDQALGAASLARDLVGTKYSWGGRTPSTGFDSTGLIQYVYEQNGISLPKSSKSLEQIGIEIPSLDDTKVGDLIYTSISSNDRKHIKIVSKIDNGQIFTIEAKGKKEGVVEAPLTDTSDIVSIRRVAGQSDNYIIDYFMSKGLTRNQAKGIYGNLMQESGGNIKAVSRDGHNSYGLAQWTGSRKTKLFNMYGSNPSAKQQLDFLWWELNNTHQDALEALKNTTSVRDATRVFMNKFEKPHKNYANFNNRLRYANSVV